MKIPWREEFGGAPRGQVVAMGIAFLVAVTVGIFVAQRVFNSNREAALSAPSASTSRSTTDVESVSAPLLLTNSAATAGAPDETFHRVEIVGQELRSIVVQRDGKIILSGYFDKADGDWHNSIVRLNPNGTVDSSFKTKAGGSVHAIALQPDGKIVLAGDFRNVNGVAHRTVARVNPDGSLDESFNTGRGGDKEAYCLAIQHDGKILVGGSFTTFDGAAHQRFVRLNANGSVDSAFNAKSEQGPSGMVAQPDGNILAAGSFAKSGGAGRFGLTRLRPDGLMDRSFTRPPLDACRATALLLDGKILVANKAGPVMRLNTDGSVDTAFLSGLNVDQTIATLAVDHRGRIIVVGEFTVTGDFETRCVARLNSDGSLDRSFSCPRGFRSPIVCAAVTPENDVIIAGNFAARVLRLRGSAP